MSSVRPELSNRANATCGTAEGRGSSVEHSDVKAPPAHRTRGGGGGGGGGRKGRQRGGAMFRRTDVDP